MRWRSGEALRGPLDTSVLIAREADHPLGALPDRVATAHALMRACACERGDQGAEL